MTWLDYNFSNPKFLTNMDMFYHVFGALLLGLLVGFERSYRGRAAGMRTYGFVCMSCCALMVPMNHPELWYGGNLSELKVDPTRVIQGVVSGIGFLGGGVIIRDGMNISGLTTAASIWATAIIGILFGIGYHEVASAVALVTAATMMWGGKIEATLPARHAIGVTLHSIDQSTLSEQSLQALFAKLGYDMAVGSFMISRRNARDEWRFVVVSYGRKHGASLTEIGNLLSMQPDIQDFQITHARN